MRDKDKDAARRAEFERQAKEEVERLTRRPPGGGAGGGMGGAGMGPAMGGMGGMGGGGRAAGPPSPLEMMAQQMRERRKPREAGPTRKGGFRDSGAGAGRVVPAGLISGSVGSGLGPAGLNPGPAFARGMNPTPPPAAFSEPEFETMGGSYAPSMPTYDPDVLEDEEMSITEMALMDQASHSGMRPEDLVVQYDAQSAEEARDRAMRAFHERQQGRVASRPVTASMANDPFVPAAMRNQAAAAIARAKTSGPPPTPTIGGALGRIAAERRQQAASKPAPKPAASTAAAPKPAASTAAAPKPAAPKAEAPKPAASTAEAPKAAAPKAEAPKAAAAPRPAPEPEPVVTSAPEPAAGGGALARLLARRREAQAYEEAAPPAPTGGLHARQRAESRALAPDDEAPARPRIARPVGAASAAKKVAPARKAPAKAAPKRAAPATKAPTKAAPKKAAPAKKAAPKKAAPVTKAAPKKAPVKAPAKKAPAGRR